MKLNKGLALDPIPSTAQTGDYRYAQNVILDNTFQFPKNEDGLKAANINNVDIEFSSVCGIIPFDKGVIMFYYHKVNADFIPAITVMYTNQIIADPPYSYEYLSRPILLPQLQFVPYQPIRGTVSYNRNGDLICIFSCGVNGDWEDKIINITKFNNTTNYPSDTNGNYTFTNKDFYLLDLNQNVSFPKITDTIITGSLLTGSYQFAVCYKLDIEYSNYSLLSLPRYIYGYNTDYKGNDGLKPNTLSDKGIQVNCVDLDTNYEFYRLAVIYNNGTSFVVYTTPDIKTTTPTFSITLLDVLTLGSLDATLTNSIYYSNSESLDIMNNRLYRANLKTIKSDFYDIEGQALANALSLKLISSNIDTSQLSTPKSKQFIKFQSNEVYALYFTLGDKKGNVIGSYPINTNLLTGLTKAKSPSIVTTITGYSGNFLGSVPPTTVGAILSRNVTVATIVGFTVKLYYNTGSDLVHYNAYMSVTVPIGSNTASGTLTMPSIPGGYTYHHATAIADSIVPDIDPSAAVLDYVYQIPDENLGTTENTQVQYTINTIQVTLPNNVSTILSNSYNNIGFWCIHRAIRNNTNSKIYTQGIAIAGQLQRLLPAGEVNTDPQFWDDNPDIYWTASDNHDMDKYSYFPDYKMLDGREYPIRFYSFEDLYNRNSNFPINANIDVISWYSKHIDWTTTFKDVSGSKALWLDRIFQMYRSDPIWTAYTTDDIPEAKYSHKVLIKSQALLEDNNADILNFYREATRQLKLEDNENNFTIAKQGNIGSLNYRSLFRANVYTNAIEYYKYIFDETLELCTVLNKITDLTITAKGDTFYSDFYLRLKRLYPNFPNNSASIPIFPTTKLYDSEYLKGIAYSYEMRFLIESKYNIHARYWTGDYPDYDNPIKTSTVEGYNKVYNLQDTENVVTAIDVVNDLDRQQLSNYYPSRIIKSTKTNIEVNQLGFRKYLALDYFDMPYNRGAIRHIASTYKNLYIQQELCLSIASVKDVVSYQDGTTYVGSGDLFDRQPVEVIPTGYGFIGCRDYFNCGMSDIGFWTIDLIQGIISLITDDKVKLISEGKNKEWLKTNLMYEDNEATNPFTGIGYFITYDHYHKRLLLTMSNRYTLSYVPEINNWLSFHYYKPQFGIYTRDRTYLFEDRTKIVNGSGISYLKPFFFDPNYKGQYSDSTKTIGDNMPKDISPMIISIYTSDESEKNKLWETLYWDSKLNINNFDIYNQTFTELFIHNDTQCTGRKSINDYSQEFCDSISGVNKKELWMFNQIFDYVSNNKAPFLNNFTEFLANFNYNKDWMDISKLMSTFACVTLFFDNYYYALDGQSKVNDVTQHNMYKPSVLLKDLYLQYKLDIR